jgi:hypothetical protein
MTNQSLIETPASMGWHHDVKQLQLQFISLSGCDAQPLALLPILALPVAQPGAARKFNQKAVQVQIRYQFNS